MAKEMMIVFIYDTSRCRKEEDDPAEAVMYFHPAWVSPTQRLALAGQLMGVYQFLSTSFSPPNLISLQGGKFVLKKLNNYIVAIGTDRNIQDWIIERRGNFLESIIKFFHCDLDTINKSFNNDKNKFTEKLYQMLETYLPILQYSANLFSNIPIIKLPKSASNIFLESVQILQYCQETNGIFGGGMFFNNKVVATQLSPELTKQLVITDPYRIKSPADKIQIDFHLPHGVQLIRVYIKKRKNNEIDLKSNNQTKKFSKKNNLKRESSRIFTVPEEGEVLVNDNEPLKLKIIKRPSLPLKQEIKTKQPRTPSVCSTPLKDVNRILHDTAVSICNATDETEEKQQQQNIDDIPDVVKEALICKRLNKLKYLSEKNYNKKRVAWNRKSNSLGDFYEINNDYQETPELINKKRYFNTITDPCYPVFRFNGSPVSQTLYNEYISCHYEQLVKQEPIKLIDKKLNNKLNNDFNDFDSVVNVNAVEKPPLDFRIDDIIKNKKKINKETHKRSMSLPLKSLNAPAIKGETESSILSFKKHDGLQLTPLMSKLSLLANEEITPNDYYDFSTTNKLNKNNNNQDDEILIVENDFGELEKAELFICGQQSMVMILLMEDGTGNNPELIHNLWETCMNHLPKLEKRLQHCMEPMPSSENKELYSVLCIDPDWDTLHRSGLWGVTELEIVSKIHNNFEKICNLTDVIVRTDETVVYANQCGKNEVFYQQAVGASGNGGLPTPADLMGVVPLKAKRRLERDHGIIIL